VSEIEGGLNMIMESRRYPRVRGARSLFAVGFVLIMTLSMVFGCTRRDEVGEYRRERGEFAQTVAGIQAAHLRILTLKVPPQLFSPREIEVFEGGSSIQDLHERSEMTLEKIEEDIATLEEEIARKEDLIRKRAQEPQPFKDLNEALKRSLELYLEIKRVEYLRWRR
jgi:hypothetical protein